jgi:phage host-nuclease inhibitor protein Gam
MRTTSRPTEAPVPSEAQARASMTAYVAAHLALTDINTKANQDIEAIKTKAAADAAPHLASKEMHTTLLMQYADGNPGLFKEARKAEIFGGHKIGYHTSPPAVTFTRPTGEKKKQTGEGFIKACKALGKHFKTWVREKLEIDKEAVLAYHRTQKALSVEKKDATILAEAESALATVGVAVTQDEDFVIDLNLQEPKETTLTEEAAAA